jgi:hypothetical protein
VNTLAKTLLSSFLLLSACAGGELQEHSADSGERPITSRGDTGREISDTGGGSVRDLGPETVTDAVEDSEDDLAEAGSDAIESDAGGDLVGPWGEIPEATPAPVADAIRASRAAMLQFCGCCSSRYANDPQLCLTEFADGGFEPDQCRLDGLERSGAEAEGYLGCLVGAYVELSTCTAECGASCSLCENNFNFSENRCATDYPSVASQLDPCP